MKGKKAKAPKPPSDMRMQEFDFTGAAIVLVVQEDGSFVLEAKCSTSDLINALHRTARECEGDTKFRASLAEMGYESDELDTDWLDLITWFKGDDRSWMEFEGEQ